MSREKEFQALVTLSGTIDPSLEGTLSKARDGLKKLDSSVSATGKTFEKTTTKSKALSAISMTLANTAGNLLAKGISSVSSAITGSLDSAISRVDTLNSYEKTMRNLGYTADEVAAASQRLQEGIDGLPTTLPGITSMQQQYAALTGDIGKAADLTVALNDATLAGGQGQEVATRAAEQWYKVIAKGKPDLDAWTSINSAMPAQMNQIAQSLLGAEAKSQDLFEAWKSGKITTEQVQDAVIKLDKEGGKGLASFAEQAQDATGGIETSMANIKTAITTGVANVLQNIGPSGLSGILNKAKGGIKAGFADIADSVNLLKEGNFDEAISKIGSVVESMLAALDADLPNISKRVGEMAPAIVAGLAANLPAIADAGIQIITGLIDGLGDGMPALINAVPAIVAGLVGVFVSNAPLLIDAGVNLLKGVADGLVQAIPVLVGYIPDIITGFINAFTESSTGLLQGGVDILMAILDGVIQALPIIAEYTPQIIMAVVNALGNNLPTLVISGIKIINSLISGITAAIPQLIAMAPTIIGQIASGLLSNLPQILVAGVKVIASLVAGILGNIGLVVSAVARVAAAIVRGVAQIPGSMISAGFNILRGLWQGMSAGVSWLLGMIPGLVSKIIGAIKEKFGIHSPATVLRDEVGKFLPPGIAVGFEVAMPKSLKRIRESLGNAVSTLTSDVNVSANAPKSQKHQQALHPIATTVHSRAAQAGRLLSRPDPVSLTGHTTNKSVVRNGAIHFSPTINVETKTGEKLDENKLMKILRDLGPEFIDYVLRELEAREEGSYVTAGAGLY